MIRDRIVVGLADQKLPEKLQLDADLTLEKAINTVRQSESVRSQQSIVRGRKSTSKSGQSSQVQTPEVFKDITESSRENLQAIGRPKRC